MARRRAYHHGDLAQALLEVTEALVAEHGVMGFSLRQAARAVGVDPAACYRHYPSREALLDAYAARGFAQLGAEMQAAVARRAQDPPEEQLRVMARTYLKFALERPARFRVMFGPRDTDVRVPIPGQPSAYTLLLELVRAWGLSIPEVNAEQQVLVLWSGVHGLTTLILDGAVPLGAKERAAQLEVLLDTSLLGLASKAKPARRRRRVRA